MKIPPKPANEVERLQALLEANILDTEPEIDFDDVAKLIAEICSTPIALVSLVDQDRQWFKARLGFKFTETPRDVAFCAHAILEPDVFIVPNAVEDERFFDNPLVVGETQVRFYAGAPITTREGYNVGEVCVMDVAPRGLDEVQKASLRTLARQVATQMEVRRMNAVLAQRTRQIEEARAQLNDLLDNATDLVIILGPTGQIQYVNRSWTTTLGMDFREALGRSILEMVAPDERTRFEILLDDLHAGKVVRNIVVDLVALDERRLSLEGGLSVRRDASGKIQTIRGIFRDITERRALEQQRQVFEDLVSHATDAILLWRRGGDGVFRLRFANAASRTMSPVTLERSMGLTIQEIFPQLVSPERQKQTRGTLDTKVPMTYETTIQLGPSTLDLRVSLIPLPGDNLGMIIENIRERKAVERIKNEFVSTVSHELRTPLTSIRGALGLIEGKVFGELPEEVMEVVGIARTSTDRLIRLINDILDIEKLDAGKYEFRLQRVECRKIIEGTLHSLQHYAHAHDVTLVADVDSSSWIMADADRIEQVVTNLVSNAVKFSPSGSSVAIQVVATARGRIRFTVRDRGQGISHEDQVKLFGRFQQLDSTDGRLHGGTGLGLAICKAIIEQHGGTIGIESELGQGSMFFFELDAAPSQGI